MRGFVQEENEENTYLHVTFGNIKGSNACMGNTTGKNTSEHTLGVVRGIMRHRSEIP